MTYKPGDRLIDKATGEIYELQYYVEHFDVWQYIVHPNYPLMGSFSYPGRDAESVLQQLTVRDSKLTRALYGI